MNKHAEFSGEQENESIIRVRYHLLSSLGKPRDAKLWSYGFFYLTLTLMMDSYNTLLCFKISLLDFEYPASLSLVCLFTALQGYNSFLKCHVYLTWGKSRD